MDAVNLDRHIAGAGTPAAAWRADPRLGRVPAVDVAHLVPHGARVVIVAPHPDDEILACGGLLQLAPAGALLVAVTDGEGSHPDSPDWPQARLRATRPRETLDALACLGVDAPVLRLQVPDGGVTAAQADVATGLAAILQAGDVVVTTWRHDGHPDHEATARACAAAARAVGATLLETPVWGWHWSAPDDAAMPFAHARKLALAPAVVARKRAALACFRSQVLPDPSRGAPPVLPAHARERLLTAYEVYFHDPADGLAP
jgi:LmbE family N-acetylglucosaminyl deacetylase